MPRIIAYTYDADVHCPACTRFDSGSKRLTLPIQVPMSALDEHGLHESLVDREGNPVHPVFSTDETDFTHCGDCGSGL